MKRFYRNAEAAETEAGWRIELDGRELKTPKRAALLLPTAKMASAIASEWNGQRDLIDPASMPMTGLANAAVDHVAPDRSGFARGIAAYGESDLLCYRAAGPDVLAARQDGLWQPLLDWAARRYEITFTVTDGIMHQPQPAATIRRLSAALDAYDDFTLAAAQPLVTISGSLVITLALLAGEVDREAAWVAGELDELFQAETWGEDEEATRTRERRKAAFDAAAEFLTFR